MRRLDLKIIAVVLIVLCLGVMAVFAVQSMGQAWYESQEKQAYTIEQSVRRTITQCYALEGFYPPNLQYLVDHYGLVLNHNYIYYYLVEGEHFPPVLRVFVRDGGER